MLSTPKDFVPDVIPRIPVLCRMLSTPKSFCAGCYPRKIILCRMLSPPNGFVPDVIPAKSFCAGCYLPQMVLCRMLSPRSTNLSVVKIGNKSNSGTLRGLAVWKNVGPPKQLQGITSIIMVTLKILPCVIPSKHKTQDFGMASQKPKIWEINNKKSSRNLRFCAYDQPP